MDLAALRMRASEQGSSQPVATSRLGDLRFLDWQ
jgi:hypothetical protein